MIWPLNELNRNCDAGKIPRRPYACLAWYPSFSKWVLRSDNWSSSVPSKWTWAADRGQQLSDAKWCRCRQLQTDSIFGQTIMSLSISPHEISMCLPPCPCVSHSNNAGSQQSSQAHSGGLKTRTDFKCEIHQTVVLELLVWSCVC